MNFDAWTPKVADTKYETEKLYIRNCITQWYRHIHAQTHTRVHGCSMYRYLMENYVSFCEVSAESSK